MPKRQLNPHPNFQRCAELFSTTFERGAAFITGAVWAIAQSPETNGVPNQYLGVWQAKILPDSPTVQAPETMLLYAFDSREVRMLTILVPSIPRMFEPIFKPGARSANS